MSKPITDQLGEILDDLVYKVATSDGEPHEDRSKNAGNTAKSQLLNLIRTVGESLINSDDEVMYKGEPHLIYVESRNDLRAAQRERLNKLLIGDK